VFALIGAIGAAILAGIATGVIDPATLPKWLKGVAGLLSVIGPAGVGVFARDNNKTSEDVGANKTNVPINFPLLFLFAAGVSILALGSGCAVNRQFASTTSTNPTNGVVTVTVARSSTIALGDAKAVVEKTRATAGKTSSVGSSGINEEANASNTVAAAGQMVGEALKALAVAPK